MRSYAWCMVREPLTATNTELVVRFVYVQTVDEMMQHYTVSERPWGDSPADLARLLGDMAEALTRPVLVERDGVLVEEDA